ncbi:MAG: bifunctional hydroxymethylpyrimidine kinase/phosphomethylpyrimidine kinase [Verrucomicrobiota bacterium]|nr:bifunctional hydroxymethylpyrimidine kinase/phosphomethylpyrimidine kinase [Verrucomicrobiota bacterium]
MSSRAIPVALTIAGSDSSAGAGAQADLKTFGSLGVYGVNAITCVVAETPGKVQRIQAVDADVVGEQITLLLERFPVAAIKTGLLYSREIVARVAAILRNRETRNGKQIPLVIDPVMVATSGDLLLQKGAVQVYEEDLFPLATLVTPNLDEAATLLGRVILDHNGLRAAGQDLALRYGTSMLLKGGHFPGVDAIDLLCTGDRVTEFSAPFTRGVHTHGTGCTYSAAITAGLASGLSLEEAIRRGKRFVTAAIEQHFAWAQDGCGTMHALNHSAEFE